MTRQSQGNFGIEATTPGTTPDLTSIYQCSSEFLGQLRLWFEMNPPAVPITSILGFSQFAAQFNGAPGSVSTTSATPVSLSGGPSLTGLSNGQYLVLWGSASTGIAGTTDAQTYVYANGVASSTLTTTDSSGPTSVMCAEIVSLSAGSNTLEVRYVSSAGGANTSSFEFRFLIALKYSNF